MGAAVERLGDVASIERYETEKLAVGRHISYEVRANWKLIVENFMECYHCATIHPELTEVLPEFADGYAAQYFVGHGAEFGEEVQGFTVDGRAGVDRIPTVPDGQDRRYYAITVKPQVFINLVPDHVVFIRMFPLAADHTRVECDWLYLPQSSRRARTSTRRSSCSIASTSRTSRPARAASRACRRAPTPTAACWCRGSTTSARSTTGSAIRSARTPYPCSARSRGGG